MRSRRGNGDRGESSRSTMATLDRSGELVMGHGMQTRGIAAAAILLTALAAPGAVAGGLDRETDTDGFDPAAESYRINEARRMNEINRQLELKYRMLWAHGFNPASPPVEQPLGHDYQQTGPNRWEYNPIYPEQMQPALDGERTIETLPAPAPSAGPLLMPAQPRSTQPQLTPPQSTSPQSTQPLLLIPPQNSPSQNPAVAPQAPAPRDAIPADRLIPQPKPRKAKPSGRREF